MRKRRWRWPVLVLGGALVVGVLLGRGFAVHGIDPHPGHVGDGETSSDLAADIRLMWETQKWGGTPDPTHGPNPRASTDRAINAASRVFNSVALIDKSRDEVVGLLGDPRSSSDSIYNFPFWPAPKGSLVYRFDCGAYGWQFNVVLDGGGRVREVERHWIH